jgi:hypothetical protein
MPMLSSGLVQFRFLEQAALSLIVSLLLFVLFLFQIARQLVHPRRSGIVFCVFRHALGFIYLPIKGAYFVRWVLKHDNETTTIPKLDIMTVNKLFGHLDGLCVIDANQWFEAHEMAVRADYTRDIPAWGRSL